MKRIFTIAAIAIASVGFLNAQEAKSPNQLPQGAVVKEVLKPGFIAAFPSSNWRDFADTSWYNTVDTNFEISTAAELAGLAKLVKAGDKMVGKTFKLMQNVDIQSHQLEPIGYNNTNPFSGNFDGNFKTISNSSDRQSRWRLDGIIRSVHYGDC